MKKKLVMWAVGTALLLGTFFAVADFWRPDVPLGMEKQRTPIVFKPVNLTLATGDNNIWTPATGKKFRLLGWSLGCNVAGAALTVKDGTTTIMTLYLHSGSAGLNSPPLGNGYLSAAADNVLKFNHGSGATVIWGTVWGTEE